MAGAKAGLEVLNKVPAVGMNGQYIKLISELRPVVLASNYISL